MDPKAPWSEFLAIAWQRAQERDGHRTPDDCVGAKWGFARKQDASMGEIFGAVIDGTDTNYAHGVTRWFKNNCDDVIPPEIMLGMIDAMAKRDPANACILYQEGKTLTAEEDAALLAGINGSNMKTMREKIARGEVPREKEARRPAIR